MFPAPCKICVCVRWIIFDAVVVWIGVNFGDFRRLICAKWLQNSWFVAFKAKYVEIGKDFPAENQQKGNACFVCALVVVTCQQGERTRAYPCVREREIFTTDNTDVVLLLLVLLLAQIYGAFERKGMKSLTGFDENWIKLKFFVQKWKRVFVFGDCTNVWERILKTVL